MKCTLYAHTCAVLENHHIIPRSWWERAGKPIASPMALICPNCHMNVHYAIDSLLKTPGVSLHGVVPPRCMTLAYQAIQGAKDNDLKPTPTL